MILSDILIYLTQAESNSKEFFGSNPEEVLKTWHVNCHPDKHEDKELAQSYFKRFTLAYEKLFIKPTILDLKGRKYELGRDKIR